MAAREKKAWGSSLIKVSLLWEIVFVFFSAFSRSRISLAIQDNLGITTQPTIQICSIVNFQKYTENTSENNGNWDLFERNLKNWHCHIQPSHLGCHIASPRLPFRQLSSKTNIFKHEVQVRKSALLSNTPTVFERYFVSFPKKGRPLKSSRMPRCGRLVLDPINILRWQPHRWVAYASRDGASGGLAAGQMRHWILSKVWQWYRGMI